MAEILAMLDKNRREKLRIALDNYQGVDLIDIRVAVQITETSGVWSPTKKGVSFQPHMLPDVIEALQRALAAHMEAA
jgi:hypothetical protein